MRERLAVVGGTGAMGTGLAYQCLKAGYPVCIGSRDAARARDAATALALRVNGARVEGSSNADAAARADIVVITVPYAHHAATLADIREAAQGKVVVDATVPLRPPKVGSVHLPVAGAAAVEAQQALGDGADVVSAFQNVGAAHLNGDAPIDCDVLVAGDKASTRERVVALVESIGMRGWHAGPLANSAAAEALTSVLIQINRQHRYPGAGIRITSGMHEHTSSYAPDHLELLAPKNLPLVTSGDGLAGFVLDGLRSNRMTLQDDDVLVIAQKVVSKAEGRTLALDTIDPSAEARERAQIVQKDPRLVEAILRESVRVVRQAPGVLIVEHRLGFVMANAGVDQSNTQAGQIVLLPENPDRSAAQFSADIHRATGRHVAVIVSDSIGRAWRNGTVGHALGVAGLSPVLDLRGAADLFERPLQVTEVAIADEIAAAASLLMGQAREGKPVVIVRGFSNRQAMIAKGPGLVRDKEMDLFR